MKQMNWYDFLDYCELEKLLITQFFLFIKYYPNSNKTFFETEAEFKYMWE